MSGTRDRLDEIRAARRADPRRPVAQAVPVAKPIADVLGGREQRYGRGACWWVETPFARVCEHASTLSATLAQPLQWPGTRSASASIDPQRALVVDIETGGFAGTPVFLIGVVLLDQRPLRVVQLLARDYPEEEAILHGLQALAAERDTWVTFNGKSFDEPFLQDRAVLHRVPLTRSRVHVDVLHAARRRWRGALPNCRLGTLEERILGRPRVGDVPSSEVPGLFHHFIHTRNAGPLRGVLEHNRIDLVSSTELLVRLAADGASSAKHGRRR